MFENLSEVTRGNSKASTGGPRKSAFQLRVNSEKFTLLFSSAQFTEMTLADNSLSQFVENGGKRVFLAVMPGNSGGFAKTTARGTKGKKFKNEKFVQNLIDNDYDLKTISLEKLGEEDGKVLYQVMGNGADVYQLPETANVAEQAAPAVEETIVDAPVTPPTVEEGTDVAKEEAIEDALTGDSSEEDKELEF
jgi:hypothetical protein